ncbi:hypothetical protein MKJ01_15085 [Chryseobacterium sp. SSA4.19]|uniref:IucA/IucC family protein n=1 Tax=Chryseobacterium sp. SSA4.19 TaxID=2919915 RepID=UPI001F4E13F6|nr:IucA/IucC family protein [Chryseobacterium sp. SSA4.19]MCJ8155091.1 hypothetical protein [Chryseobacterium sp. SSA4.19]
MKAAKNAHSKIAQKEITKRLIKSLMNEREHSENGDAQYKTNHKQIQIFEIKKTNTFLIIFQGKHNKQSVIEVDENGNFRPVEFRSFLHHIFDLWNVPDDKRKKVLHEVSNSYQNMKTAFEWEEKNLPFLLSEIDNIINCSSFSEIDKALRASEAIPFTGHPLHVCTKTKFGLSKNEIYEYCPEFFPKVELPLLSVKKEYIKEYGNDALWMSHLKSTTLLHFNDDETVFPVHPWHLKNMIFPSLNKEFKEGIIRLNEEKIVAYPTLSFRTHALQINAEERTGLHVKLPVAIQATSVFRLLSERDIYNGIIFSENLSIYSKQLESVSLGKGIIVNDVYGSHLTEEVKKFRQGPLLSFTLRENPSLYASDSEKLVVASSLTHATAYIEKSLLIKFQEKSGLGALDYLERLLYVILYLPIEIFLKLGIALDTHGQNCLIRFNRNFIPNTMVYRDLGSIQMVKESCMVQYMSTNLTDPAKTILSYQDCIDEFFHSLYYNLIGHIIDFSAEYYNMDVNLLWKMVKNISLEIIETTECAAADKIKFKDSVLKTTIPVKSLLRMRILDSTVFSHIPNPLLNHG